MTALVLRGGMVLSPAGPVAADVLIKEGVVAAVGADLDVPDALAVDCSHAWVGPGFVDLHAHTREPGHEWKEDTASASACAIAGGYTAIVAMPNTEPATDAGHLARFVTERGRAAGLVEVVPAGCLTAERRGERLAHLDELWEAGVRLFTDDGDTVMDAGLLRRAMEYVAQLGGLVAQHAIDPGLARNGQMHEGQVSSRLGMIGIPGAAEEVIVARDLALVRMTGVRYHVQHVSTAAAVELVRSAKEEGLPVTAEATPHHLALDERDVMDTDSSYKMMPPLRATHDVVALREGLEDGTIDAVATDHAPHASVEKDVPFEEAPFGVIGLETAAAVVNTYVGLGAEALFARMAVAPAAIAGLSGQGRWIAEGEPANITVFDPSAPTTFSSLLSKSANCPFLGLELQGRVRATVAAGRLHEATHA